MKVSYNSKTLKSEPNLKANRFKEILLKFRLRVVKFFKSRKLWTILGILALMVISFIAGIKFDPYLTLIQDAGKHTGGPGPANHPWVNTSNGTNQPGQTGQQGTTTTTTVPTNTNTVAFIGKISAISPTQLDLKDKDNVTKQFAITAKTVLVSLDGKAVKSDALKIGYSAMLYAVAGDNNSWTLIRLKVTAVI
jgi:hypothetical protein